MSTINRKNLITALGHLKKVVPSATGKTALTMVKVQGKLDHLTLAATDMDVLLMIGVLSQGAAGGPILVDLERFAKTLKAIKDVEVEVVLCPKAVEVKTARATFKLNATDAGDFPSLPTPEKTDFHADDLGALVNRTQHAVAHESARYAINGALLERREDRLTMVATDGRRLVAAKGSCSADGPKRVSILQPKALRLIPKLFSNGCEVEVNDERVICFNGPIVLVSNKVEGKFPPWRDVIPKSNGHFVLIDAEALLDAVGQAGVVTTGESKGVALEVCASSVAVQAKSPDVGEVSVDVPAIGGEGDPVRVGVDPKFLTDAVKSLDDQTIRIEVEAPNKPIVLRGEMDTHLIMPVDLEA